MAKEINLALRTVEHSWVLNKPALLYTSYLSIVNPSIFP